MSDGANENPEAVSDESLRRETLRKYRERMFGDEGHRELNNHGECVNEPDRYRQMAKSALDRAHEIRKFEIDLLWKRAAYIATFQAFLFAALGVSFSADNAAEPVIYILRLIICVIGAFSSLFWLAINKGSKFWSQNWEKHIDFLEDEFEGKLYKTVLTGDENRSYSVSRVNISISVMFFATWFILSTVILIDVVKWLNCFASRPYWIFAPVGILVLVCFLYCCGLHTRFKSVDAGKSGTKAEAFFVKRELPRQIKDSPLSKVSILREIWLSLWRKKSRKD